MSAIPQIQDLDDEFFDPFRADEAICGDVVDPFSVLRALRRQASVHPLEYRSLFDNKADVSLGPFKHYTVLGYDEVSEVCADPKTYTNGDVYSHNLVRGLGRSLTALDGAEHAGARRILRQAFTPEMAQDWAERYVAPAVDELISEFEHAGRADLFSGFAVYYPFRAVFRMMGLPEQDIAIFHRLAQAVRGFEVNIQQAEEAKDKLGAYFTAIVEHRRAHPQSDLISALANAEVDGERAPDEVLISVLRQMINAAADTIHRATSTLLVALLNAPEQLAAVTRDRALLPGAIEEGLRWDGPVLNILRYASRDVRLGGVAIPQGSILSVVQGSANRDETKFADPDRFDIHRVPTHKTFVFSQGPHMCLGRHVAIRSMEIAMNALLDRLPNLRLDPDRPRPVLQGFTFRTPRHIYVRFG